jgi:plastocyanin
VRLLLWTAAVLPLALLAAACGSRQAPAVPTVTPAGTPPAVDRGTPTLTPSPAVATPAGATATRTATEAPAPSATVTPAPAPSTPTPSQPPAATAADAPIPSPTPSPSPPATPPSSGPLTVVITASRSGDKPSFDRQALTVPAGATVTVLLQNSDAGVTHNLTFSFPGAPAKQDCTGPCTTQQTFPAPVAGSYYFLCTLHDMFGTFTVTG